MTSRHRIPVRHGIVLALVLSLGLLSSAANSDLGRPDVRIGWTAWSDAEAVSKLTALTLSSVGMDVELTLANIQAQYRGLAEQNLDLMLMSWQPHTHAAYLDHYGDRLEDLGVLYDGTTMGLAVPDYVDSSIQTIADLADHPELFDGVITGIDPEAGVMADAREAMRHYGLDGFELSESTGPAMVLALERAFDAEQPVVVTAWRPHSKWAAYDLRYLDDPDGVFADSEAVHAMARAGLREEQPRVAAFIEQMAFELDELEALMADAEEQGHRNAIRDWLNANQERVHGWFEEAGQ
ncbi:glycine betaine ABC transporter substrate-binding protein [Aquisalimonas asiatica]|uniref:Glycine betaine/proline transport system substrate-binding protein n=1 Tax=Aquisalimonas asiatica TaxID=406100 RepID=A0A1H8UN68_9GAMM|nr:glycine betaine ABC transporter substrate-binding protein [Aquisalimonas asiatica]SEP04457.1 glycine betaine/proline transport system substrate-binding protein [Aquisalimonas asiatica]